MKPEGNVQPFFLMILVLNKIVRHMVENEEQRNNAAASEDRQNNPQDADKIRDIADALINAAPVTRAEKSANQELSDPLYELCSHQLGQKNPCLGPF